jgi:hypothetical protein
MVQEIDTWRLELLLLLFFALKSSFVGEVLAELLPSLKMALASERMSFSNLSLEPELGRLVADEVALETRLPPHDSSIPCSPKITKDKESVQWSILPIFYERICAKILAPKKSKPKR